MPRKRILLYTTQLLETGGIESHVKEFLFQLVDKGKVSIDVLVLNAVISKEQCNYIKRYSTRSFLGRKNNLFASLKICWFILRSLLTKYDALYTNGQGNSIYLLSRCFRYRNWVHHHHTAGDLADQKTWTAKYIKALKTADILIACSGRNAADIQAAMDRSVLTIPCFSRAIEIPEGKKRRPEKVHLGYYGRLIPEKGIDLITKLSSDPETSAIQFHIWGAGEQYPPVYFSRYPNLLYHGPFNGRDELTKVLSLLDGYLLLSTHPEGLPISLLEVMSAGLPWLATNRGGISDIACDPMSTRLLDSAADFDSVKKAVLSLASYIKDGKVNQQYQQALYRTRFSADVLVKQWTDSLFTYQTAL